MTAGPCVLELAKGKADMQYGKCAYLNADQMNMSSTS